MTGWNFEGVADWLQLNSVGLTKNLLRALNAQSIDLPPLESFPKSQIVTFKYYVGVIHFLDEKYAEVGKIERSGGTS
jgi:hypothetical protein